MAEEAPVIRPIVNRQYLPLVLQMLEEAEDSIEFIHLEFHYDPTMKLVQNALADAAARGVKVRGILEDGIDFNQTSLKYLQELDIDAVLDTPKKMLHNKLFVVDRRKILLGSTNLSGNSLDNNNETNLYVEDDELGGFFLAYFEALRSDSAAEPESEPLERPGLKTVINRQHFDELFGLLNSAEKRVRVMMYGIKYYKRYPDSKANQLLGALIAARERGVDVRVILDKSDYNETLNQINETTKQFLEEGGVDVRYDPEDITTHAKLVIADDRVVVGSANWGYDALERRNECSLVISEAETVESFERYFLDMWRGDDGKAPPGL